MPNLLPIQQQIWNDKYRFIAPAGIPRRASDDSIEDTWRRIARALAEPEGPDQRLWEKRFYSALENFAFLPAGRIIAGAGTGRDVTMFNCFVMGRIPDSMDGIFSSLREAALTLQQGGGVGMDFSTLRPRNAEVKGVAAKASGPVSFMDCWDAMCKTIMGAGVRRGAMMGTLRCDHPDIEEFIDAKRDPLRLRNFNVSVLVTNDFMHQVKVGGTWPLQFGGKIYNRCDARELWSKIMRSAYEYAEPGVIFIDRINETNNLNYCETIYATNPCAEQPLPPYGACLLGSINLTAFIRGPFSDNVYFDAERCVETTKLAVRMLDNVIDVSNYPLPEQRHEAHSKRRIGLGVTGLADALAMCGLHYGSPEACRTAALWMESINAAAYQASMKLAIEKGMFPAYQENMGNHYFDRGNYPTRNSHLTSVAPTGTISLLAGNISSGIEPIYEHQYKRRILTPNGEEFVTVEDYAVRLYREMFPGADLPPQFQACAHDLSPKQHLAMQAALQPFVDSSISKTVNCPRDMSFEDFEQLYLDAYEQGLKVCAAFRPNETTGSILQPVTADPPTAQEKPSNGFETPFDPKRAREIVSMIDEISGVKSSDYKTVVAIADTTGHGGLPHLPVAPREKSMSGRTHKIKWGEHAVYITINNGDNGPYEIFINSLDSSHYAHTVALTRMISAIWRRGGDVSFVAEELKQIADPRGGVWMDSRYVPSLPAAIGYVIEEHIGQSPDPAICQDSAIDYSDIPEADEDWFKKAVLKMPNLHSISPVPVPRHFCPKCHSANVWFPKANCLTCRDCSFSNCE